MYQEQPVRTPGFVRTLKKFFVSAFLIVTFVAYVLHERSVNPGEEVSAIVRPQGPAAGQQIAALPTVTLPPPTAEPATPAATAPAALA